MTNQINPRPYITILPNGKPVDALEPHEAVESFGEFTAFDLHWLNDEAYEACRLAKPEFRLPARACGEAA